MNKTPEEQLDGPLDAGNSSDDAINQCEETEMFFSEMDMTSENVEFGKLHSRRF